ncbi:MAG: TonB family protein [Bacteroidota bacterium]
MKKIILTPLLLLSFISVFAQKPEFELHSQQSNPIKKEKLATAEVMSDIIPGYPTSWIMDYVSVSISGTCNGKTISAKGTNEKLTTEQKNILNTADLGTHIWVNIEYKCVNAVSQKLEISDMHYKTTYAPDVDAEYVTGNQKMTDYLNDQVLTKIPEAVSKALKLAMVNFTINERGEIDNAKISRTSGDATTDKLLLEAINSMPKWKPAKNSNGTAVKQNFEFILGGTVIGGC